MLFFVLVVLVTVVGMTSIFFGLFSADNAEVEGIPQGIDRGPMDALWWVLKYVVRLRAFEDMYGATVPILMYSALLSIMGLAVFGVLVSLINNSMRDRIELLRRGDTPVKERGHLLILGWNNKVFSVLRQVAALAPGRRVVILARRETTQMIEELRVAGIPREPVTVILRSGIPTNRKELERVAVDRAGQVIVLSSGQDDSEAIKTLVLLATWPAWPGRPPTLAAEIALERNYELAQVGAGDKLEVISSSRVTSKIIVQTIRNPGLARVYDEIMSTGGNSIFVQSMPVLAERTMRELAYGFADAVPIGISWQDEGTGQHKAGLNPEPDYDLAGDEALVFLAPREQVSYQSGAPLRESQAYRDMEPPIQPPKRILLIGWTDILYDIVSELNAHSTRGTTVTVLHTRSDERQLEQEIEEVNSGLANLTLEHHQGDGTQRACYESVDLTSYDSIAVLAEAAPDGGDADTRALRILLRLTEFARSMDIRANIVVELVDVANRDIIAGLGVQDVVVSTEVISAQLAQVSRQPVLGAIYRELLSAGGVEIALRPVTGYVDCGAGITYWDLAFAAQQRSEVALGLYHRQHGVLLNPDRSRVFNELSEQDSLIVLAEQLYR